MFDRFIRAAFVSAVAFALFASCTTRSHAATDCPKPPAPVLKHHHKHKVKAFPIQSCVASTPLLALWQPLPDPLPITIATRYADAPAAVPTDIVPPLYVWQPMVSSDAWITPFIGSGMSYGSYTGGARTYNTYKSYASTVTNQTAVSNTSNVTTIVSNTINSSIVNSSTVNNSTSSTVITINKPSHHDDTHGHREAPEIDGGEAAGGLTLLAGILLVIRSGKRL